jgi:hypothetical protein
MKTTLWPMARCAGAGRRRGWPRGRRATPRGPWPARPTAAARAPQPSCRGVRGPGEHRTDRPIGNGVYHGGEALTPLAGGAWSSRAIVGEDGAPACLAMGGAAISCALFVYMQNHE